MIIDSHTHSIDAAGCWVDPPEAIRWLLDEVAIDRAIRMTNHRAPLPSDGDLPRMSLTPVGGIRV